MQIDTDTANSQVTPQAKRIIYEYLGTRGVEKPRELLLHTYRGGDFVCISYRGQFDGTTEQHYIEVVARIVRSYEKNKFIEENYGTIWVHRKWIEKVATQFRP